MKLVLIMICVLTAILLFGLCRASAIADQQMMISFQKWLQEHPEEIQQQPAEEII